MRVCPCDLWCWYLLFSPCDSSHSISVWSFAALPYMDLTMIFVTLCPYLATLLLPQVEWKYFHSGLFAFNLSASSEEIIEALLWSSIMAYAVWASSQRFFFFRYQPILYCCRKVHKGAFAYRRAFFVNIVLTVVDRACFFHSLPFLCTAQMKKVGGVFHYHRCHTSRFP